MFLLVPAHPGCPGQIPQSRKTVVCCVCVCVIVLVFSSQPRDWLGRTLIWRILYWTENVNSIK